MSLPKISKILRLKFKIKLETGMHIGGVNDTFKIGGTDSPVLNDVVEYDGELRLLPIIPGSTLKGKMRSLLELTTKDVKINDSESGNYIKVGDNRINYDSDDAKTILKLFGKGADDKTESITRLIIRDAKPTEETIKLWDDNDEIVNGTIVKGENTINRITSSATPRFIERVPPGSEFETELILLVLDGDTKETLKKFIEDALILLENNYLGGHGSRGYGKIKIKDKKWEQVFPKEDNNQTQEVSNE